MSGLGGNIFANKTGTTGGNNLFVATSNVGGTGAPSGGLFSQNLGGGATTQTTNSLFNNTGASNNAATIGQNNQTNPINANPAPGGLFNNNNNNANPSQTTSLFANQTNTQNTTNNNQTSILGGNATANTTTTAATTATTNTTATGINAQPGTQNNAQQPANNIDVSLTNEKLNPLVQKWKRKIQGQSENLLQIYTSLGESLTQIEQCSKYYENLAQISQGLNGQFDQINVEVKNIEQYQTQIEQHLEIIRQKLSKQLELQGDSEANAFKQPIGEKIQAIDFGLSQIEKNVNQLIDEINPQKEQTQDSKKTISECLNSYYQILEKLEYDTINLQFKLQSVAEKVSDQI